MTYKGVKIEKGHGEYSDTYLVYGGIICDKSRNETCYTCYISSEMFGSLVDAIAYIDATIKGDME